MKCVDADILLNSINTTIMQINAFSNANALEKAYLAKFLVVFISGIYEEAIETIVNEKIERLNRKYVSNYIKHTLKKGFRNPSTGNILNLLSRFNNSWKEKIKSLPQQNKEALDNIVTNKNSLAHGISVILTLSDVLQYYQDSRIVIEAIDDIVL